MMRVDKAALRDLCQKYGQFVQGLPDTLAGERVLWALAGSESAFGARYCPRHEDSYHVGGKYFDENLSYEWGCLAHESLGPWQVMGANLIACGFSPLEVIDNPEKAAEATVAFLNRQLARQRPVTLMEIGQMWNTGDKSKPDQRYVAGLLQNYAHPYPLGEQGEG